ncbi:hypothetical protein N9174_02590 [bacterium]|nr:hypothetical protein [bacterium]
MQENLVNPIKKEPQAAKFLLLLVFLHVLVLVKAKCLKHLFDIILIKSTSTKIRMDREIKSEIIPFVLIAQEFSFLFEPDKQD